MTKIYCNPSRAKAYAVRPIMNGVKANGVRRCSSPTITDGKPRQLTIAYAQRNARFLFSDPDTGAIIHDEKITWPKDGPKVAYCAFRVTGRFKLELFGEPFKAVFIDPG